MWKLYLMLFSLLSIPVIADSFGVSSGTGYQINIEDRICGTQDSPDNDGTLDSVRAFLNITTASHNVHCAIYMIDNNDDTVWVDSTEVRSLAVGGPAWYWFDFIGNANIYSDSTYYIVAQAQSTDGECFMYFNMLGAPWWYSGDNYAAWPSTITGNTSYNRDVSIEAYYTPATTGGPQIIIVRDE